jgi:sugar phosphate isomerase/epimerase
VELGTGNYPGDAHCKLSMLEDGRQLAEFQQLLADQGCSISALSCHGNPLHPNRARAEQARDTSRKTILLAEKIGVPVVVDFSGCPGDSPQSTAPNWITCPWPPDYLEVLDWQWNEVVTPYWTEYGAFAAQHNVKIAIEMHPGFVVYNPETMLRLRAIAGPAVGCNYDPSHMFWQGIDPIAAMCMRRTRNCIRQTCQERAFWILNRTPKRKIAVGFFAPAAMATERNGGKNSLPHCGCSATTVCSPSNMKIALCLPRKG